MKPEELKRGTPVCITKDGRPFCNTTVDKFPLQGWPNQALLAGVDEPVHINDLIPFTNSGIIDNNNKKLPQSAITATIS